MCLSVQLSIAVKAKALVISVTLTSFRSPFLPIYLFWKIDLNIFDIIFCCPCLILLSPPHRQTRNLDIFLRKLRKRFPNLVTKITISYSEHRKNTQNKKSWRFGPQMFHESCSRLFFHSSIPIFGRLCVI